MIFEEYIAYNEEKGKSLQDSWELGWFHFTSILGAPYNQEGHIGWLGEVDKIKNQFANQHLRKIWICLTKIARFQRAFPDMSNPQTRYVRDLQISQSHELFEPLLQISERFAGYVCP
jgi:hypothetical protein